MDILIGHTGFVGTTLLRQRQFDAVFNSKNIGEVGDKTVDLAICAAAPAQKWIANKDPEADRRNLDALMSALDKLDCQRFVLISTVDVFKAPTGVDESSQPDPEGLHAYGANRLALETFARNRFRHCHVVRLPGLVGPGLRKNVLYDFKHQNNLSAIDHRGVFQFYPMVNLWADLQIIMEQGLETVHLTAAPLGVGEIAREAFGLEFTQALQGPPARYDFRSIHADRMGGASGYHYSARESLLAIRAYAQSVG